VVKAAKRAQVKKPTTGVVGSSAPVEIALSTRLLTEFERRGAFPELRGHEALSSNGELLVFLVPPALAQEVTALADRIDAEGATATDPDALKAEAANINARRHIELYKRERDGLLIWRAYAEIRKLGLEVPEAILRKFDAWGAALVAAADDHDVALAIEMTKGKKGSQRARLIGAERRRDIVELYAAYTLNGHRRAKDARALVARRFGTSPGNVAHIVTEWGGLTKKRSGEPAIQQDKPKPSQRRGAWGVSEEAEAKLGWKPFRAK
jgi:hypothetical protein